MPKSYGGLWNQITSFENILAAFYEAQKGKKYKPEVLLFKNNLQGKLISIQGSLKNGTWTPSPYREFWTINEIKRRLIQAPAFKDRVVHHALMRVTLPFLEKKWIYDSYACRINKGTHKAVRRVQEFLIRSHSLWENVFVLQIDISKYFPTINHDIAIDLLNSTFRESEVRGLFEKIIRWGNVAGKGVPIGSLTSQSIANHYLNEADHFAKECIKIKFYVRYMDDIIIIGPSKEWLHCVLDDMRWFIEAHLRLALNPKTRIYPANQGVDFAGYRTWWNYIRPRKRNLKAAKERFKHLGKMYAKGLIEASVITPKVASFIGYMKHCNGTRSAMSALKYLDYEGRKRK